MTSLLDPNLNPIDRAVQTVTPTVMVPRHEPFQVLTEPGHRFLVAEDGLWLEVFRPWLYTRLPVAQQDRVAMPYGKMTHHVELGCGKLKWPPIIDFMKDAGLTPETEIAGGVIWNEATDAWRYERFVAIEASGGHIKYERPRLQQGEHLVLDMHSHGKHPAYFSETDNTDDRGDVKLALVIGKLKEESDQPDLCVRLCALGIYVPANLDDFLDQ